ncbi:MAG: hypothetical protein NZ954_07520 [Thermofilaceae archaeon]|nr:hypothetical protein [Thermofilaceae archaeon]MCX8180766.1 hypothetical protein [Thermofilaceae archaeon]MDW8004837.1 hypothetical protein [Thermofilaceae archaeon]
MNARVVALTSVFTALGVVFRLLKHAVVGSFQFFNAPLTVAMVAAYVGGPVVGALSGMLSFVASDVFLGLGLWTPVNASLAGFIGVVWGIVKGHHLGSLALFSFAFLSVFIYDILSSLVLYLFFLGNFWVALVYSFVGLYLPVMGGYMFGIGPLTELVTSGVTTAVIMRLRKHGSIKID